MVVDLTKGALERGHSVSVACTKEPVDGYENYPEHLEKLIQMEVPLIFLDSTFSRKYAQNLEASRTLLSRISEDVPDIIHSHASIPSLVSMIASSRLNNRIPIIQTMHGWGIFKSEEQERQDIEILNLVDHVISISRASENLLVQKGLSNPSRSCIYNGLERTPTDNEQPEDEHLVKIKAWRKDGHKIIGVIGTVDARKNQSLVLEALSLLPESLRFQAIFVGEGDDLAAYREKAKTLNLGFKVTFTGYKPSARSYIKECDLLVSASLSEGAAPLAILEAFAEKTLVLASDTPENKDSIEEAKNGFLFRSGNASDLSEKMESCLLHEDDGRITAAAHELFRNRYLFEQTCESYLKLYECCRNEGH